MVSPKGLARASGAEKKKMLRPCMKESRNECHYATQIGICVAILQYRDRGRYTLFSGLLNQGHACSDGGFIQGVIQAGQWETFFKGHAQIGGIVSGELVLPCQ